MDKVLLKKAAFQSFSIMIAVVTSSFVLMQYQTVTTAAITITSKNIYGVNDILEIQESFVDYVNTAIKDTGIPIEFSLHKVVQMDRALLEKLGSPIDQEVLTQLSNNYIIIKKPEASQLSITSEDLYINKSIKLMISGVGDTEMSSEKIIRVRGKEIFSGTPSYTEKNMKERDNEGLGEEQPVSTYDNDLSYHIEITHQQDSLSNQFNTQITLQLDNVYAYKIYEDENNYYLDLRKPSEVYDRILVIDAGHGGKDGGALSKDGTVFEKNINLDIVLNLKELLDKEDIKVYYTRTADDKVFLRPRAELANAVDCDYFISIHCNANDITSPNGTEILYYDTSFKGVKSSGLASIFSEEIGSVISLKNRGSIKKQMGDIFIMDKSRVPMILIETGYMTNNADLAYLSNAANRKAVAQGIFNGIMRAYEELPVNKE
ncbi:MAG: N-acetylmuramoyl-L-alanine amidase [Herbinix sp.]|nr:N-acetylmuramoyl-L-alanine amidase [Herbinix sp.]